MSYKNYQWSVLASDYNSPFIRNYIWTSGFPKYPKLFGFPGQVVGMAGKGAEAKYIGDLKTWESCHNAIKARVLADSSYLDSLIDRILIFGRKFNRWTEKNIYEKDVQKMSAEKIIALYKEFIERQSTLYALGVAVPILDFQNFSFVEGNLEKFLHLKLDNEGYNEVFRIFTEPAFNSFALDQEIALLKLMSKFYHDGKLEKNDKFDKLLKKHAEKYGWVYYVYAGPAYTVKEFAGFVQDYLIKGINPAEKLKEIRQQQREIKNEKKYWLKKLQPDKFNKMILSLAGKIVWAKPRRKDLQSRSYYHLEKLQREIGRRLQLSLSQVRSAPLDMVVSGLNGEELDLHKINQIQQFHVCVPNDDLSITVLIGEEAKDFYTRYNLAAEENVEKDIKEIKGACAYPGLAKGVIKKIDLPQEMEKMEYGDILLSTGTTPSIVPAMKKAAAIITDEGGLTCHASIVSRELHIPCVVGLKIATKVLKDGDFVEVDANAGLIKRL